MSAAPVPERIPKAPQQADLANGWTGVSGRQQQSSSVRSQSDTAPEFFRATYGRLSLRQSLAQISYRSVEILVAVCGLILTAPAIAVIAVIIKRDSPGPAVFRQTRIGLNGKPFYFYKFRTLYADARQRWPELYAYQYTPEEIQTLVFKTDNDPRVTRVGSWLRRTTLDEMPNLYNLLRGDVAMVGPRPEIYDMIPYYRQDQMLKFIVKPGLTGLAQVSGRNRLTFQETLDYDIIYVHKRSWRLDAYILWETVRKVLARDGAF